MKRSWKQAILSGLAVIALTAAGVAVIVVSMQKVRQRREIERLTALTSGLRKVIMQYMIREARYDEAGALAGRMLGLDPKNNEAKAIQLFVSDLKTTPPWKLALEKKLDNRVSFDFGETPFRDVIVFLQEVTNTTIILNEEAIRDLERPYVTLRVTNMKLGQALNWITARKDLKCSLLPEGIYITSAKDFVGETTMHPYDVICSRADAPFSCHLFRMPGRQGFRLHGTDGEGSIVKISGWGEAWRFDAPSTEAVPRGKAMPADPPTWLRDASPTLERKVTFDFSQTPLRDVMTFLQEIAGANIILSEKALADVADPEVTLKARDMKLGQAIHWMLQRIGLQYLISGEVIYITTEKRAAEAAQQSYYAINVTGEIRARGGDPETTFSGWLFYHLPTGGFFVLGKDADGYEIELKGMNTAPRAAAE